MFPSFGSGSNYNYQDNMLIRLHFRHYSSYSSLHTVAIACSATISSFFFFSGKPVSDETHDGPVTQTE